MMRLRRGRAAAPQLWALSYADLMSLLLVLFVFIHAVQTREGAPPEPGEGSIAGGGGWAFLGRASWDGDTPAIPAAERRHLERAVGPRLDGRRFRVAVVGFGETHRDAIESARSVRTALARPGTGADRFLLVSGGPPRGERKRGADVYSAGGLEE